jgi:hypothetical protein
LHIIYKAQLAFVINDVALLAGDRYVPLLSANQEELVVWDVKGLEISWEIVLSQLILINEL